MADKIPIKGEDRQLKKFSKGDTVPVKHGGTGRPDFNNNTITNNYLPKGYVVANGQKPLQLIKCEYDKDTDPTPTDDIREKYSVGSRWINIKDKREWLCIRNNYRDALWISCCFEDPEFGDTFRYYMSLVDFKYDHQKIIWERRPCEDFSDPVQVIYRFGGNPASEGDIVGVLDLTYNENYQIVLTKMTYEDSSVKLLSFSYNEDDYITETTRID